LGITIQTVADLAGYSYTTICVWERGDRLPNLEALMSLCRIYKVTPNDVLMEAIDG
jgi:DNA-binding XRE family transcriptional regulator